jgi:hypothetical protein
MNKQTVALMKNIVEERGAYEIPDTEGKEDITNRIKFLLKIGFAQRIKGKVMDVGQSIFHPMGYYTNWYVKPTYRMWMYLNNLK